MEPQTELLAHKEDKTMYELNKIAFGSFLAQLRREKGMTQKELAACLYVSDKAVSKCLQSGNRRLYVQRVR